MTYKVKLQSTQLKTQGCCTGRSPVANRRLDRTAQVVNTDACIQLVGLGGQHDAVGVSAPRQLHVLDT